MATKRRKRRRRPQAAPATPGQSYGELENLFDNWSSLNLVMLDFGVRAVEEDGFADDTEQHVEKVLAERNADELEGWEKAITEAFADDTDSDWNASYFADHEAFNQDIFNYEPYAELIKVMRLIDECVAEHGKTLESAEYALYVKQLVPPGRLHDIEEAERTRLSFKRRMYLSFLRGAAIRFCREYWMRSRDQFLLRCKWEELPACGNLWIEDDESMPARFTP